MMEAHNLGCKLTPAEVAALFEVTESTVKRQYGRYGGGENKPETLVL